MAILGSGFGSGSVWFGLVLLASSPFLLQAPKVLEAVSGQNVTLECYGPARSQLELLQWVRLDLAHNGYVYFYRQNRSYQTYQIPAYRGRVSFREPRTGPGDVSLVLRDVEPEDTGTYECRTSDQDFRLRDEYYKTQASIRLTVTGYRRVHADPGQDLVLPCSGPKMEPIQLLQWNRLDDHDHPGSIYVHELGKPDEIQIQDYKDRVYLRDPKLTGGDAALVLKDIRSEDAGTYSCYILFQRPGPNPDQTRTNAGRAPLEEMHHLITLTVSGHRRLHADPGQDLVLPCSGPKMKPIHLLQWSRLDHDHRRYVYVHELGKPDEIQIQDYKDRVYLRDPKLTGGDAALVLKDIRSEDAGNYSCYILFQRPGPNPDQTRTNAGRAPLEEMHHLITLTVSGSSPGEVGLGELWPVIVLFAVILTLCGVLLLLVLPRPE